MSAHQQWSQSYHLIGVRSMKHFFFVYAVCLLLTVPVFAQLDAGAIRGAGPAMDTTNSWTVKGNFGLNAAGLYVSQWLGGGQNNVNILGLFNVSANYRSRSFSWDNALELGYGRSFLGNNLELNRKSDDRIIFVSKAATVIAPPIRGIALVDFRTQFDRGFDYTKPTTPLISNLFAPAFLVGAVGVEWKPADNFNVLIAPATGRMVIVADPELSRAGAFGVTPGTTSRLDIGALLNAQYKQEIVKDVTFQTRWNFFAPYSNFSQVVIQGEALLVAKFWQYFNISIAADYLYDPRIFLPETRTPAQQFRLVPAFGFSYPF
jgi:hypothetical protein